VTAKGEKNLSPSGALTEKLWSSFRGGDVQVDGTYRKWGFAYKRKRLPRNAGKKTILGTENKKKKVGTPEQKEFVVVINHIGARKLGEIHVRRRTQG